MQMCCRHNRHDRQLKKCSLPGEAVFSADCTASCFPPSHFHAARLAIVSYIMKLAAAAFSNGSDHKQANNADDSQACRQALQPERIALLSTLCPLKLYAVRPCCWQLQSESLQRLQPSAVAQTVVGQAQDGAAARHKRQMPAECALPQ